ncbi:hypothetical protein C8Q78DRAFT_119076 [Trametes maxima]|nr:hypothetical protein C8Q78DRAFT_119076 [Trametes maxima]
MLRMNLLLSLVCLASLCRVSLHCPCITVVLGISKHVLPEVPRRMRMAWNVVEFPQLRTYTRDHITYLQVNGIVEGSMRCCLIDKALRGLSRCRVLRRSPYRRASRRSRGPSPRVSL